MGVGGIREKGGVGGVVARQKVNIRQKKGRVWGSADG